MQRSGTISYCPLVKTKRKWADRMKVVESPLFGSYLFVLVDRSEEERVLQTNGVVDYVKDFGKRAEISPIEIDKIKNLVNKYEDVECVNLENLKCGDQVSLVDGIFFDLKGEVIEVRGKQLLLLMKGLSCGLVAKVKVSRDAQLLTV